MNRQIQPDIHPDVDSLNAFVERALPEPEHDRILEHVAGCARCRDIVYLAQQMAGIETAPLPALQIKAEPRHRWWAPGFAHWRIAWIPAAALAALGGVLLWVHVRSLQPAVEMAKVAPPPALPANVPPPATAPSVASSPEPDLRRVEPQKPIGPTVLHENKRAETTPKPGQQANRVVPEELRAEGTAIPASPSIQPRPAISAPAQVALEPSLTNTQWQAAQPVQRAAAGPAMSAKSAQAPATSGMVAVHGGIMAPATAGPTPIAAAAVQPPGQYEVMPQPLNGLTALRLTKHLKLPSGLATISSAAVFNRLLAVDSAGTLFLSIDAGKHWDTVPVQWAGKAIEVHAQPQAHLANDSAVPGPAASASETISVNATAPPPAPAPGTQSVAAETGPPVPAMLFRLVNDRHRTWISTDGKTWREQPQ